MPLVNERAVFLSYASQDADAARRICEALRAAGVEVWFDQNELVGGDQWDAKIRRQIAECALFVPVISAATQARLEGYFRIEWKLAARRTHAMATAKAFLLPVVIDDTRDAEAHVPDEFREVQWTRLPGGEATEKFCARVKGLLGGSELEPGRPRPGERGEGAASPKNFKAGRRIPAAAWMAAAVVAIGGALFLAVRSGERADAALRPPAAQKTAAALSELARLRARIQPDRWQKQDFDALSATLDRLISQNPEEPDAWALRSIINSLQVMRNFDSGTKPLELGKSAAERALRIAPNSSLGELALGMHLAAMFSRGGDVREARAHIERGTAGLRRDALTRYADLTCLWLGYQFDETLRSAKAWLAEEPRASFPAWILAQWHVVRRQPGEAEKWAEQAAADTDITGIRALVTTFETRYYLQADLPAARAALEQLPAGARPPHRLLYSRWLLAMAERQWDQALQELARLPDPILFDRNFHGPKTLLAGLTHQAAGRAEVAVAQFREAERALRAELAQDADNEELRAVLAVTLACADRADDARHELAALELLMRGRMPSVYTGGIIVLIAQAYGAMGDTEKMLPWLRRLFVEPSALPFTPASFRFDPRFNRVVHEPPVQALLTEFAGLDQRKVTAAPAATDAKSVAVLAFANLSDDKANEYFSDGISEELLNVLAKVPGLQVSARTSAFSFKGKNVPIPEIARQLGVAYVVEGSVRKAGDKVRITAQLIKAADGFHLWSDTFTRDLKDIFAVQDEIAGLIAGNLEIKIAGRAGPKREIDPEAYQHYLSGRAAVAKAGMADLRQAVTHFERALAREPAFAAAWVQLAAAHTQLGRWGGAPTREAWPAARAAINRARALEPESPDVFLTLGWILRTAEWDWRGAEQAFRRAMSLRSHHPDTLAAASVLLFNVGKQEEAFRLGRQAAKLDPLNAATQIDLSLMFFFSENWIEAEQAARRALQLSPAGTGYHAVLAWSLIAQKRTAEGEAELALDHSEVERFNALGLLALVRGEDALARAQLAKLEELARADPDKADLQQSIAWLCAGLGEKDRAFAALEKARASRDPSVAWSRTMWPLRPLYSDPRWSEILRKIGLADEQLK